MWFLLPRRLRSYVEFLQGWAISIKMIPGLIRLPSDLATADEMEDAAIETYALLTQGRG